MGKLTKRTTEALAPREIDYIAWDQDVPGFGVRVMPSGRKSFVLQYRAGRRSRRMVLGYIGIVTPEQARGIAIQHLAALRQGVDPLAERDTGFDAVTVKDLAARFDAEHVAVHLKASTQKEYRRSLKKFILPAFGKRPIAEVSREEVARFHHKYRHVPYQANRCLEILSKMFNLAELWGLRPDGSNPRKRIKKYREEKRERFLSAAELRRVGEVLREMEAEGLEMPSAIAAVMLLILTGCRLNEIMTLRWEYVDFAAGVLNLPDSKTGAKTVHLGKPAIDTLRRLPHLVGNPWVICGIKPGGRLRRQPRQNSRIDPLRNPQHAPVAEHDLDKPHRSRASKRTLRHRRCGRRLILHLAYRQDLRRDPHRHEPRSRRHRRQFASPHLSAPAVQQTAADLMPARHLRDHALGSFADQPNLLLANQDRRRPTPVMISIRW